MLAVVANLVLAACLLGARGAPIPLSTQITVSTPVVAFVDMLAQRSASNPGGAQKPYTAPWDPSLRPSTAFLPLDAGQTADNSTGNQPSQVRAAADTKHERGRRTWLAAVSTVLDNHAGAS